MINSVTPPLGLAMLAAVLEKEGHEVQIIDALALELDFGRIIAMIDPRADFVGFTATTPEINGVIDLAGRVRKKLPDARILMGGVHPSIFHEELVREGYADAIVRGEGEEAVRVLASGAPMSEVPNLTWRNAQGQAVVNDITAPFADMNNLPFPAYEKLPMKRYRSALGAARRSPSIGVITSRGCPGKCTFCYSGMFGERIRFMTAERVYELVTHLMSRYGIREVSFYDDTFTSSRTRVEKLCSLLIDNKVDLTWSCFARTDTVAPELLKLMRRAGCHQIGFGFESSDDEILKNINKKVAVAGTREAIRMTREAGIDVRGAFMLGNHGETPESMQRTIDYAKNAGIQFALFNITTPYPGTALYEWATSRGYVMHRDWNLYDLSHPVLNLPTVTPDQVSKAYRRANREFYLRPSFILQRLLSIRSWGYFMTHVRALAGIVTMLLSSGGKSERRNE